ncbi:MAG: hypothetical protein K2P88_06035 [Chitinophagaceae bacterium]|uniref:hypothetical protein n=1 Tax=unclassified Paraflavitalea TaxID=2798305 RepID=UPI003D34F928|nr:hypothetical protein [Chitinophagaceae bacterium]
MKNIVPVLMLTLLSGSAIGQTQKQTTAKQDKKAERRERISKLMKQEEEGEVVFNKQSVFGFKMVTDGYGISYEFGKFKSNRVTNLFQFDFNEKKHPKEKKISLFDGFGFSSIIFGKTNNFYQSKFSFGQQRRIGGKGNRNGISVSGIYTGGFSLGMLKPYYVNVLANGKEIKSTFPTIVDSNYAIGGAAGITYGWKDLKIKPGVQVRGALRFDYGRFNEAVSAIEVGLAAEYYTQKISQVAYVDQKQLFFTAYMSFLFGRRK